MASKSFFPVAVLFSLAATNSTPAAAQGEGLVFLSQLERRQKASVEQCAQLRAEKGDSYKEGDCKTFYEKLDDKKWGWAVGVVGLLALAFLGLRFLPKKRENRA